MLDMKYFDLNMARIFAQDSYQICDEFDASSCSDTVYLSKGLEWH